MRETLRTAVAQPAGARLAVLSGVIHQAAVGLFGNHPKFCKAMPKEDQQHTQGHQLIIGERDSDLRRA